ncbi:hypothetical protein B0H66DRAFT_546995 [Apodospora peruviana]|uniref:Uncharacterized protein n=1 Tax=Apodospora peruviana TaxID=516989 RepID=A0AAE0IID4_9PEZI|nr:hypothetical protein B0H66DRAFT_546995 [Apodospora peruviana]
MALLPDFGTWLFRSVRRDPNLSDSPISIVERLNSLPRPLKSADKDTLLGAVLTLGPSLQLALLMLLELMPEDESRGRLGEVLCPTLGQLQKLLHKTLGSFDQPPSLLPTPSLLEIVRDPIEHKRPATSPAISSFKQSSSSSVSSDGRTAPSTAPSTSRQSKRPQTPVITPPEQETQLLRPILRTPTKQSPPQHVSLVAETFPKFDDAASARTSHSHNGGRAHNPAADLALMKELRAEMRVNAAIQVAVDSLEFAEGQMKIVREVNRLHGSGSFDLLQKHFYDGYNRILFRALELEQREFDSPSPSVPNSPDRRTKQMQQQQQKRREEEKQQTQTPGPNVTPEPPHRLPLVSFDSRQTELKLPPLPPLSSSPTKGGVGSGPGGLEERRPLARRNTVQGTAPAVSRPMQAFKRRLSLAEELALVGDGDSTTEEESEVASESGSDDESEDSEEDKVESDEDEESSEEDEESDGDEDDVSVPEVVKAGKEAISVKASRVICPPDLTEYSDHV